jgi:hypothetical protein
LASTLPTPPHQKTSASTRVLISFNGGTLPAKGGRFPTPLSYGENVYSSTPITSTHSHESTELI